MVIAISQNLPFNKHYTPQDFIKFVFTVNQKQCHIE
jgi:hypothetical protein